MQGSFTSVSTCAEACIAAGAATCRSYSYQGTYAVTQQRLCQFHTTQALLLNVRPDPDTTAVPTVYSDRSCAVPAAEVIPCGTPSQQINGYAGNINLPSLTACSGACNRLSSCKAFLYDAATRQCLLSDLPADAATRASPGSRLVYNKGCPVPLTKVCDAWGAGPNVPTLVTPSKVRSYYECALQCQGLATCQSFAFFTFTTQSGNCNLFVSSALESGYETVSYQAVRWSDKQGCPLPAPVTCVAQASNYPTTAFKRARNLQVGFDNISQCEQLCRRDSTCRSYSWATENGATSCRTYTVAIQSLAGLNLQPTGAITFTNTVDCSTLYVETAGLQNICGPPVSVKPGGSFIGVANTASNLAQCAAVCQSNAQCQSWSHYLSGPTFGCYAFYERATSAMVTAGPEFDSGYAKLLGSYDRACPLPA